MYGYGSAGIKLPECYLKVAVETESGEHAKNEILYTAHPYSIYHLTKKPGQTQLLFFNKNDGVRVTDLHKGIV